MGALEAWALRQNCVLVSLATAGSRDFYESRGYMSKAGYYKKYIARDWAPNGLSQRFGRPARENGRAQWRVQLGKPDGRGRLMVQELY